MIYRSTMKKHLIKIGTSNFRKLVSTDGVTADLNRLFVDKTLFIKDFLDHSNDVVLITRPRRWGKSSALSMLQHFFSKEVECQPTARLFENLKIAKYLSDPNYNKYQGNHPVILVTFKDLKGNSFEEFKQEIAGVIAKLYREHDYLLDALKKQIKFSFNTEETYESYKNEFITILEKKSNFSELKKSLQTLSLLLRQYYSKKVFILIDEYDNAINNSFDNPEILKELTEFFSSLFSSCLKENEDNLEKGLITGILRVAKANIFSGLNNPTEETILDYRFSEHYGFTETEVNDLLSKTSISNKQEIKTWYNGYIVGNNTVYNPWSIVQCIAHNGDLEPYWANSANPKIIRDLLINKTTYKYKQKIRDLIKNKQATLLSELEKYVSYEDLQSQPEILWSLLAHTGYLTVVDSQNKMQVKLPNQEVIILLKKYIDNWFTANAVLSDAANSLLVGDFIKFEEALKEIFGDPAYSARIFSDGGRFANSQESQRLKERVYQFLIMTELRCVNLTDKSDYEVFAELENVSLGKTRPDVLILNHNHEPNLCIVIEIKSSVKPNEDLKKLAGVALAQIARNQYGKTYQEQGYHILPLGIAFKGDNFELSYEGQQ